jgi:DNA-binding GntR family transcriptional regulator
VLQALENEGLVETKQSVGTIVTSIDLKSLRDVYAVRMILAEALGRLSHAARARDSLSGFHELKARSEALLQAWNFEEFVRINNELQHRLGLMTGNEAYERITAQLYYQTVRAYFQIIRDLDRAQEVLWLHEEIAEMIRAIEANDAQAVGFVRRNHISMNLVRITNYVLGHTVENYPSRPHTLAGATSAAGSGEGQNIASPGTAASRHRGMRGAP